MHANRRKTHVWLAAALAAALFSNGWAADWKPTKPVRMIVGFPQGGRAGSRRGCRSWGGDGAWPPGWMRRVAALVVRAACAVALACALPAVAQKFPTKPVRLIVGFPPGGATDLVARIIQPKMSDALGRQLIVDNRPGANGIISNEIIAHAEPDGYTVGFAHIGTLIISPTVQKVPYDPHKDFAPIGLMVTLQNIIITHPTLPVKNLKDLIALAKTKPGQLNYATSGVGSPGHLAAVLLESMTSIRLSHVPYKGGGPAMTDLLSGQIPIFVAVISTAVPQVQAGKVRALAVTGTKRASALPDVPTVAESGVKGYAATNWYGLVAPAKTPQTIIDALNKYMTAALKSPDVVHQLKDRGIDSAPSSPSEFARFVREEEKKWVPIIRKSNITG